VLALTGSNGKTTTKELIHSILSTTFNVWATPGNYNNHIGVPLTMLGLREEHDMAIIEMGASGLKEIELLCKIAKPTEGFITNIGLAHIEGFGGVDNILKGKTELYEYLRKKSGLIYLHADDAKLSKVITGYPHIYSYAFSELLDGLDNQVLARLKTHGDFIEMELLDQTNNESQLVTVRSDMYGDYNALNILVAIAVGRNHGVSWERIVEGVFQYLPKNNRSQILELGGMRIVLDAYNANPTSMQHALNAFRKVNGKKCAILGTMNELGEETEKYHASILSTAQEIGLDQVVLVGEHWPEINDVLHYSEVNDLIDDHHFLIEARFENILIKGSRSIRLEKILQIFE